MNRSVIFLAALSLGVILTGCFAQWGRSGGRGAAQGALEHLQSEDGQRALRTVLDSAGAFASDEVEGTVVPELDTAWSRLMREGDSTVARAERRAVRVQDSLATRLEGRLGRAVDSLVARGVRSAGTQGRKELSSTMSRFADQFASELSPTLTAAVSDASRTLVRDMSKGVRTELAAAAESALARGFRAGVQASAQQAEETSLWQTIVRMAIGAGGLAVLLIAAWLWRGRRRREKALEAVAEAIHDRGDERLKRDVKRRTTSRRVEGWFRDFLVDRDYLMTGSDDDGESPRS